MSDRFTTENVTRPVENGQVFCIVAFADVDIESCWGCALLSDILLGDEGTPDRIVCSPTTEGFVGFPGTD